MDNMGHVKPSETLRVYDPDAERTRNYALRLQAMAEDGRWDLDEIIAVLRQHAAGPPPL